MANQLPVAIVGIGCVLPDATDPQSFWQNIRTGWSSVREVPPDRWNPEFYYDPDPSAPDKTYSKIGAWVQGFKLEPLKLGLAIPPRVLGEMEETQKWAIAASHQALADYGYPRRQFDPARVAVILGNLMAGEKHYITGLRIRLPEYLDVLKHVPVFQGLPKTTQAALLDEMLSGMHARIPISTEDTLPGELGNVIAGRVANLFNFAGPNFTTDAACASSLAAFQTAIAGLNSDQYDAVLTGGVDRNMGPDGFVKFCKIGALSPDGSRPYDERANGFIMGEGAVVFLLKRLADAERDGDRIYAVVRSVGGSSDGKGKGITAPNPLGQQRAIERAWKNVGLSPATASLIEGHGTATQVGDVVEVGTLNALFNSFDLPAGSVALGSVKSNIGHLKGAAGAASLLKTIYALHDRILPPSINFERPNPQIDFAHSAFKVNTVTRPWEIARDQVRRAGISSFGFGGTNFHMVVEEYIPGLLTGASQGFPGVTYQPEPRQAPRVEPVQPAPAAARPIAAPEVKPAPVPVAPVPVPLPAVGPEPVPAPAFYRGLLFLSAETLVDLKQALLDVQAQLKLGTLPTSLPPSPEALRKPERLAMDYGDADDLARRIEKTLKAFETESANAWASLAGQGIFRGRGLPGKVAFLFPGQGSQYPNMLRDLCAVEPITAETFREADEVMTPILGRSLTSYIFVDEDPASISAAEAALKQTAITQPAVLTANVALLRLMAKFGFTPDLVVGHSLGEYAALVAAGVLSFPEALEVVSNRGRAMAKVSSDDNGCMAAVSAPLSDVERILKTIDGYVVIANINSPIQSVIGGSTPAVDAALRAFEVARFQAVKIPVSHAFHTAIVAPASAPLRGVISRTTIHPPHLPVIANVTGQVYPNTREEILDILAQQVASPVQMVRSMQTLYEMGARVYVEIGPKRVLNALAVDNLKDKPDVTILATNHPRKGSLPSFNEALAGLYAAGVIGTAATLSPQGAGRVGATSVAASPVEHMAPLTPSTDGTGSEEIKAFILGQVSEKTGYPVEMLDLNLDLEADLGIDTVKQAEMFLAMREHFDIPRPENLRLADYNTLAKVIRFAQTGLGKTADAEPAPAPSAPRLPEVVRSGTKAAIEAPDVASSEEIKTFILSQVTEKTGYPAEMLDLNLDLEADLGIDTVKQAELFLAMREHYNIPRPENLRLADYNTLAKVIGFVTGSLAAMQPHQVPGTTAPDKDGAHPFVEPQAAVIPALPAVTSSSIRRRVPRPVLRPRLDLCLPTGVKLDANSRLLVVKDAGRTADALLKRLQTLKVQAHLIDLNDPHGLAAALAALPEGGPIAGVYFLPSLEAGPGLEDLPPADWQAALERRVYSLFTLFRSLPEQAFLVCGTAMGGLHGYGPEGAASPLGGATTGFAKALARERGVFVKVVDFSADTKPAEIAGRLIDETLRDPGIVEVGYTGDLRYGIALLDEPYPVEARFDLPAGSVFLVSGGTGGITGPVVLDLARAVQGTFYLLGRAPLPGRADPDLQRLPTDRMGLKKDLRMRAGPDGNKPTPVEVEARLAALDRAAATLDLLHDLRRLGSRVEYLTCDVTDLSAVDQTVQSVLDVEGRVDVLIHAAGFESSRRLDKKTPNEFRQTLDVKASGFYHLFKALAARDRLPRAVLGFTSIAGRFGNSGQTDYSAANDLLCKLISALRGEYPEIHGLCLDWGPWAEVGMASRGHIPALMKMGGVDMLNPQEAAPLVRLELQGGSRGEVLLSGSMGPLDTPPETANGSLDLASLEKLLPVERLYPLLGRLVTLDPAGRLTLEVELDPQAEPFLRDHTMNHIPVLPGVIGIQGFLEAARLVAAIFATGKTPLHPVRLEDIQFLAPVKFYRDQPRRLTWSIQAAPAKEGLAVQVLLESDLALLTKVEHLQHFSGRVILQPQSRAIKEAQVHPPEWVDGSGLGPEEVYRLFFHGPAFQVLGGVQRSASGLLGSLRLERLPMAQGISSPVSTPALVELVLQTASAWQIGRSGVLALPQAIESLALAAIQPAPGALYAEVTPMESPDSGMVFEGRVVDTQGHTILSVAGYRTSPLPFTVEADLLQPFKKLVG